MSNLLETLKLDFSPAVFQVEEPAPAYAFHIGWFLPSLEVNSASVRYRCFHMARALHQFGVRNSFFTDPKELDNIISTLEAVIVVKRLDPEVIKVVARAHEWGKPVYLDICDDLVHDRSSNNSGGRLRMVFAGIAPFLDGIVTSSVGLAERMTAYCRDIVRADVPVHIIPDIAENEDLFHKTAAFVAGIPEQERPSVPVEGDASQKQVRKVLWFGNWGGPHSNFGIASLIPMMTGLRSISKKRKLQLELVIVSNNEAIYEAVIKPFGVPTRYVPWSPESVYAELRNADVALLTTGDDDFSAAKSLNRILQALAMRVPVVTSAGGAFDEFVDSIIIGQPKQGLIAYLGAERDTNVAKAMASAQKILPRYSPEKLGSIWRDLLSRKIENNRKAPAPPAGGRMMIIIETGNNLADFEMVLAHCKERRIGVDVVVNLPAFKTESNLLDACAKNLVIPSLITGPRDVFRHRLLGASRLIIESSGICPISKKYAQWASELGIPVQAVSDLRQQMAESGLPVSRPITIGSVAQPAQPGPYPERLNPDGSADWTFVVHEKARGWILDGVCREIGSRQPGSWQVAYLPEHLPPSRNYFFSHHTLFMKYLRASPDMLRECGSFIYYTHPRSETQESVNNLLEAFEHATQVIFMCNINRNLWLSRGLKPEKCRVVLGGADQNLFRGHERGNGVVGLSSSFYERKNPDCLLRLIELLPHRNFLLIGRRWERYALFEKMKAAPNFTYLTIPYQEYPEHYRKFDVILSMSTLEGGPIPLLEAMMCNAVPVASRTGFAPDVIRNGENGFLFDVDAPAENVASLIEAAFVLDVDIRESALQYDWENFSRNIVALGQ